VIVRLSYLNNSRPFYRSCAKSVEPITVGISEQLFLLASFLDAYQSTGLDLPGGSGGFDPPWRLARPPRRQVKIAARGGRIVHWPAKKYVLTWLKKGRHSAIDKITGKVGVKTVSSHKSGLFCRPISEMGGLADL